MIKREKTTHIIIHTAAASSNGKAVDQSAETIRNYHVNELGWDDIGYHYVIRFDGSIEQGRDERMQGAHCRDMNMNERSIGICCSGHGDIKPFTELQIESLRSLTDELCQKYDIPNGNILGHRETGANKTCPGTKVDMYKLRGFFISNFVSSSDISLADTVPMPDSDGKDDFTEGKEYEEDFESIDLPVSAHETFDNRNKRTNTMKPFNETAFGRTISGQNKTGRFIFSVIDVLPVPNVHEVIKAVIKDAEREESALNTAELVTLTFQRLDYMRTIVGGGLVAAYLLDYVSFEKAQEAFQLIISLV